MSTPRDSRRAAVYRAEAFYTSMCARANPPSGPIDTEIGGRIVRLPAERHFGQVGDVDRYIAAVLAADADLANIPAPRVRVRRGNRCAHWSTDGTIALPDTTFGRSEHTVLHELAHHVAAAKGDNVPAHGRGFCYWLTRLHTAATGPEGGWALSILLDNVFTSRPPPNLR